MYAILFLPSVFTTFFTSALLNVRYDLARLIIGSEGTLGVITEVTLRLQKLPSHSVVSNFRNSVFCYHHELVCIGLNLNIVQCVQTFNV